MQSNPTEITKPQTSVFCGPNEKHQLRLYLLRTERAQVALQVPAGHQLHNDECGLALWNYSQETNLHECHTWQNWLTLFGLCICVCVCVFVCKHTTWWQLNSFMTEASFRNSILSLMLADSLTVLIATRVSGSSLTTPFARPSYTIPKEPWPSSRLRQIFSRATSHSSGTYTRGN